MIITCILGTCHGGRVDMLEPLSNDWWGEQARIVGATQRQAAFARTMVENPGAKFNKVAELRGIITTPH